MIFDKNEGQHNGFNTKPNSLLGKLPPQATDVEKVIIGAIMLEKDALYKIPQNINHDVFYEDRHQKIFKTICQLSEKNAPIDMLTVIAQLRTSGELELIGGSYYIMELTKNVTSAANIEYHCLIVYQKFLMRELIKITSEATHTAYEDTTDVLELIAKTEKSIYDLSIGTYKTNGQTIKELSIESKKQMLVEKTDGITGIPSGFKQLDSNTGGWQKSDLIIIAARPAMGKTAFVVNCARNAAVDFNKPVVIFSLEMGALQLTQRLQASEATVKFENIRRNMLSEDDKIRIDSRLNKLERANIIIDDTPALNIFEFRAKCRRLKNKHDIELIIIDYLQLMVGNGNNKGNREQEIGQISRSLKMVAKELNVPVIALSQLSRAVEGRSGGNKKPQLSDLRESGSIEQDADQVFFLYRPEYYGITKDEDNNDTTGRMDVIGAKFRNGELKTTPLLLNGAYMQVSDWHQTDDLF